MKRSIEGSRWENEPKENPILESSVQFSRSVVSDSL